MFGALLINEGFDEPAIKGDKILALASLYIIGRLTYAIGYMFGAMT